MSDEVIDLAMASKNVEDALAVRRATQTLPRLTLFQLIFGRPGRYAERCAQEGRESHIKRLRVVIEQKREMLSQLPDLALARKHAAQLAYGVTLQEIECWRDTEAAKAKADIKRLAAELEIMESDQCA